MDNLSLARIYARNCSVRRITIPQARDFLAVNHRMGYCSCKYRYGLFVDRTTGVGEKALPAGTLVAVASFSAPRNMTRHGGNPRSVEWIRYASQQGYRVVGGMGKLLSAAVTALRADDVMTYVNAADSNGDCFRTLGFVCEGIWSGEERDYDDFKFRKTFLHLQKFL